MILIAALALISQDISATKEIVTIAVAGDAHYTRPHSITISPAEGGAEPWVAVRTWEGGHQTLTSTDCAALSDAVRSFDELPAVTIDSPRLALARGERFPIGPFFLDGFSTSLSFETATSDGSLARVQLTGGTAYRDWGHRTVAALIGCWGPLTP